MKDINSIQSGIVQENSVNNPSVRTYKGKNQFPQSFEHPSTCQYGYVDPVAVAKCEVGDVFPYKFVSNLKTFTMKSPLMSDVKMYSAAFKVPMEAIYPNTYDILFSFAQKGDTVPQDRPTPSGGLSHSARAILPVRLLFGRIYAMYNSINSSITDDQHPDVFLPNFDFLFKCVFLLESMLSAGSIFSKMNIHLNSLLFSETSTSSNTFSFDNWFDTKFYPAFVELCSISQIRLYHYSYSDEPELNPVYQISVDTPRNLPAPNESEDIYYCSVDRAFELLRTGDWTIKPFLLSSELMQFLSAYGDYSGFPPLVQNTLVHQILPEYINIEPIIAYQLACVHFFNNSKIDYLYTVNLWRDNLESIYRNGESGISLPQFEYNGSLVRYDVTSFAFMNNILQDFYDHRDRLFRYFFALFAFCRSLRYGDYFVGARPEPIGVGDINLDENSSGSIDSLEVARKLQLTRLLHKVAITGPEHSQQIKYIFGGRLPDVPKDVPIRLSLEEFDVQGFETNNTGSAQLDASDPNITTTNLVLNDSKFMFEVEVNEPCWLVMVQYFEAHRIYSNTIDRFAFHYDIYDDFVPDMQFIGDQDVNRAEIHGVFGNQFEPFAYHLRNMEYKQRYSYASGGFIEFLKSWAFVTDNSDGTPAGSNITPEYIRSSPSEFDRFYKSLLGHSLGSRFHFITKNTNVMAPYRQMVYAPEILS